VIHFKSDRSNQPIPHGEVSELKCSGCLRQMLGRSTIHLTKSEALALAKWLGFELVRPELETIEGPEVDPGALRVEAISRGSAAGSNPPKGRAAKSTGKSNRART
jgi:hypothetical protein